MALMLRIALATLVALQADAQTGRDISHSQEPRKTNADQTESQYFQDLYMAQASPDELEFGHVRETPGDWEQRFEKINLKHSQRQGKVRWGDKHGGYGEHYWDYNHDDRNDDDGEESQSMPPTTTSIPRDRQRRKRARFVDPDVEFVGIEGHKRVALGGVHGGNYRRHPRVERIRREFPDEND